MKTVEETKKEVNKELFGERLANEFEVNEHDEMLADLRMKYEEVD